MPPHGVCLEVTSVKEVSIDTILFSKNSFDFTAMLIFGHFFLIM